MTLTIKYIPESDPLALYLRYDEERAFQPAHIDLDPANGIVEAGINPNVGPPHVLPAEVWDNRVLRYNLPEPIPAEQANALLDELCPLFERVAAGHEIEWNGITHVGHLVKDDAREAHEAIVNRLETVSSDTEVLEAEAWLVGQASVQEVADSVGITTSTSDAEIREIAFGIENGADMNDVLIYGGVDALADTLRLIRDRLAEEMAEAEE